MFMAFSDLGQPKWSINMHGVNIHSDLGQREPQAVSTQQMNPISCFLMLLGQKIKMKYERFWELLYVGNIIQSHLQGKLHHLGQIS